MRKIIIALGIGLLLLSFSACPLLPTDGTIAVSITNAAAFNTRYLYILYADSESTLVGANLPSLDTPITGGAATSLIRDASDVPYIGTAGSTYQLLIMIDADGDTNPFEAGVDYVYAGTPFVTVDGNTTFSCVGANFILQ